MNNQSRAVLFSLLFLFISFRAIGGVPEWAKSAIWYQIFPERFRNVDTNNDPSADDLKGSWPHDPIEEWHISPWNVDWYKMQTWEEKNGNDFYYNAQLRRYGGDIQGIIDKLDYLQELGITAIYLNPVFESPSLHKYDATFYHHIDNNFGSNPERDKIIWSMENPADPTTWRWTTADSLFLRLVQEVHNRGMKIVIDGVFNHVGMTFWAFEDVKKNGKSSKFKEWFTVKSWEPFDYEGWYGVKELPELKEGPHSFDIHIRDHIHAVVKRWMDPNGDGNPSDGIDGWRLDVADMVNLEFWKEFRKWTREINSQSYLVGEVWWENWGENKMFDPAPWIQDGKVFDAVMNYRVTVPILNYFTDKKNKISSTEFAKSITELYNQFQPDVTQVQMNTVDSHDTDRLPSIIVNPDREFDHDASIKDNKTYNIRKPNLDEIKIQKLIVLFQLTSLGAPHIYYGDECGMWGGDDPDGRKPMVWDDISYEPEVSHPFGKSRPRDSVYFDDDLFQYYKKMITIRMSYPALALGTMKFHLTDNKKDVIIFERKLDDERFLICFNNSDVFQSIEFFYDQNKMAESWVNIITGETRKLSSGYIKIDLESKSGVVLKSIQK
ncbi:MAG: glycoside hydrolase family 13 protein [Ignavibacteriales bacterium]|nr:glycoside hydrolase family 13 protein [Ignavibacteriales bacterium]